jgi:hypothetical protein
VYLYQGNDGIWKEASDSITFHIQTPVEQVEYEFLLNEQQFAQLNTEFSNLSLEYQKLSLVLTLLGSVFAGYVIVPPLYRFVTRRKRK